VLVVLGQPLPKAWDVITCAAGKRVNCQRIGRATVLFSWTSLLGFQELTRADFRLPKKRSIGGLVLHWLYDSCFSAAMVASCVDDQRGEGGRWRVNWLSASYPASRGQTLRSKIHRSLPALRRSRLGL